MIKIICVGKIKKQYLKAGIEDYQTRLKKYTKIQIVEVMDDPIDDPKVSIPKEQERILKHIKEKDFVISLEIDARQLTSNELSTKIESIQSQGYSDVIFVIGGSNGLGNLIQNRANLKLSISKMTFPHQLFRLILLEQIYRSYKIKNNESYHK